MKACSTTALSDFPLPGERSTPFMLNRLADHLGGSAVAHSSSWARQCKFQPTDYPAIEHLEWSKTLDLLLCVDQLDAFNLCSAELIVRNLQRIEDRFKDKILAQLDSASGSDSLCFTSTTTGFAGLLIDPKLHKHFGDQAAQQAQIAKEQRKVREERALTRKKTKKDQDDG